MKIAEPNEDIGLRLYERDIDVMIHEEILHNEGVAVLLAGALGLGQPVTAERSRVSDSDAAGETDVLAVVSCGGERVFVLIENKIDAVFQPRQAERYRERAAHAIERGDCQKAHTLLVAPKSYLGSGNPSIAMFDASVSYEDLADAIEAGATTAREQKRARHRAGLVRQALESAAREYVKRPVAAYLTLWRRVYAMACAHHVELRMAEPEAVGSSGYWITLKADLPPRVSVDWKMHQGVVDLTFAHTAERQPKPGIDLSLLRRDALVKQFAKSSAIRVFAHPARADWSNLSDEDIRAGLAAASQLYAFYRNNPVAFA